LLLQVLQYHTAPQRRLPPLVFYLLTNELSDHLIERGADGAPVLGWYHRQWWEAAARRYASNPAVNARLAWVMADYFAASWKDSAETMTIGSAVQLMKAEFAHRGLPEQPLRLDKASCLPRLQSLTLATAPCTPFTPC
jgi:hypothetical protein